MRERENSDESKKNCRSGISQHGWGEESLGPRNLHKDVCDAPLSIGFADCFVARDDWVSIFR